MGDISIFMKELKQRFTLWFNKSHGRFGTIWAERFKSILVQERGRGFAALTVATYIDLNPLRAGLLFLRRTGAWIGRLCKRPVRGVSRLLWEKQADRTAPDEGSGLAGT